MIRRFAAALLAGAVAVLACTAASAAPADEKGDDDSIRSQEYWLDEYGITKAWETTQGKGVKIAVIDTGVGHAPELDPAVVGGTDVSGAGTSDGRTPVGTLDANHGSWVASLAAARNHGDKEAMIGVAPKADILSISIGFPDASPPVPFTEQVVKAMHWAVDHGAKVINLSFTTNTLDWDESWDDAFLYAYQHDVVVVVAAGNRGSGTGVVGAPATIPGVLTVAGVTPDEKASRDASTQGITIGVSAPSERLLGVSADGEVVFWEGTSGAAPIVSGIVALVRAAHPNLDAENVIERVTKTARRAPGMTQVPSSLYGYGLVDAAAAVADTVPLVSGNSPTHQLEEWIRLYRRAPVQASQSPAPTEKTVEVPPLPRADRVSTPVSPLLPDRDRVLYGSIPLMAVTVPAILVLLGVTVAARRLRSARPPGASRRKNL